jgi:hypothetical protein
MVDETGQPYAYTGDDPLNATDPLGLYSCAGKSSDYVVKSYKRGGHTYRLTCGYAKGHGEPGSNNGVGVRHIQEDNKHFGGNLSGVVINQLLKQAIASGKENPERARNGRGGPTIAIEKTFVATGADLPPETEQFDVRVVINTQTNLIVTAFSPSPAVDDYPLDNCHFAGIASCGDGYGSMSFGSP